MPATPRNLILFISQYSHLHLAKVVVNTNVHLERTTFARLLFALLRKMIRIERCSMSLRGHLDPRCLEELLNCSGFFVHLDILIDVIYCDQRVINIHIYLRFFTAEEFISG